MNNKKTLTDILNSNKSDRSVTAMLASHFDSRLEKLEQQPGKEADPIIDQVEHIYSDCTTPEIRAKAVAEMETFLLDLHKRIHDEAYQAGLKTKEPVKEDEECIIHSTDMLGKCFICGKEVSEPAGKEETEEYVAGSGGEMCFNCGGLGVLKYQGGLIKTCPTCEGSGNPYRQPSPSNEPIKEDAQRHSGVVILDAVDFWDYYYAPKHPNLNSVVPSWAVEFAEQYVDYRNIQTKEVSEPASGVYSHPNDGLLLKGAYEFACKEIASLKEQLRHDKREILRGFIAWLSDDKHPDRMNRLPLGYAIEIYLITQ